IPGRCAAHSSRAVRGRIAAGGCGMNTPLQPPLRPEYEHRLEPFTAMPIERRLPLPARLWTQDWVRKGMILILLAVIWEMVARWQDNDLLFPTFSATARALAEGLASGELIEKVAISLRILLQGYAGGVLCAFLLTAAAVSTRIGRDLLDVLTAMFNPLPAIALLP